MEFKTAISKMTADDMVIRGVRHSSLVASGPFSDAVFLLLSGRQPGPKESVLFGAMLTSVIDHGMGTASALSARFVASTGNPLNASVAAGVLALGDLHGGAIEQAMLLLTELRGSGLPLPDLIRSSLAAKRVLHGYGHKVYKEADPRTALLIRLCDEQGFSSAYLALAKEAEEAIAAAKGKRLVLNVDGCIAALLLEMGFSPAMGKGFFIIGRVPGLVAHAVEEREREKPVRRLDEEEIRYDGK